MINFNLMGEPYGIDDRSQSNESIQINSQDIHGEEPAPFFDPRSESQRLQTIPIINRQLVSYLKGDKDIFNISLLDQDLPEGSPFSPPPLPSPFTLSPTRSSSSSEQAEDYDVYCKERLSKDDEDLAQSMECPPPVMVEERSKVGLPQPFPQTQLPFSFSYPCSSSSMATTHSDSLREKPIRASEETDQTNSLPLQLEQPVKRGFKRKTNSSPLQLEEPVKRGCKQKSTGKKECLEKIEVSLSEEMRVVFEKEKQEIDEVVRILPEGEIRKLRKNLREKIRRNLNNQKIEILVSKHRKLQKEHNDLQIKYEQQAIELQKLRKMRYPVFKKLF